MGFHESRHELLVARVASALIVSSVAENHDSDKVSRTILIAIKLTFSSLSHCFKRTLSNDHVSIDDQAALYIYKNQLGFLNCI